MIFAEASGSFVGKLLRDKPAVPISWVFLQQTAAVVCSPTKLASRNGIEMLMMSKRGWGEAIRANNMRRNAQEKHVSCCFLHREREHG